MSGARQETSPEPKRSQHPSDKGSAIGRNSNCIRPASLSDSVSSLSAESMPSNEFLREEIELLRKANARLEGELARSMERIRELEGLTGEKSPIRTPSNEAHRDRVMADLRDATALEKARSFLVELKAILAVRNERLECPKCLKNGGSLQLVTAGKRISEGVYSSFQYRIEHPQYDAAKKGLRVRNNCIIGRHLPSEIKFREARPST